MQKVIVIVGPTASGKTALSVELARKISGEVISADSRQVYRGLDIGSGKVTKKEMRGIPHHLLDVASPRTIYTASDFVRDGRAAISEISSRGTVPIIAGGTGFYIDSLLGTITLSQVPPNQKLRKRLQGFSLTQLQRALKKLDKKRFETIDVNNPVRLIRAIEIATSDQSSRKKNTGDFSSRQVRKPYTPLYIGLTLPSEELKDKIHARLLARIRGIEKEVKKLHTNGLSWKRMEALGLEYRYMARYLQKKISKTDMLIELEKEVRHYAKRQMTWFRRNKKIIWISPKDTERAVQISRQFLKE